MSLPTFRIFVSSPTDVGRERAVARRVIENIRLDYSETVSVSSYFWEDAGFTANDDFTGQIPKTRDFDLVVCILWRRLGSRLHAKHSRPDGTPYESGTEYEVETALESQRVSGSPALAVFLNNEALRIELSRTGNDFAREDIEQWNSLNAFLKKWFYEWDSDGKQVNKRALNDYAGLERFERQLDAWIRSVLECRFGNSEEHKPKLLPKWTGEPFRWLEAFEFEHAAIFKGRTRETGRVISLLNRRASGGHGLVVILGASGSGKSSLARAGVLPLLVQEGVVPGFGCWRRAVFTPGECGDVFASIASAVQAPTAFPKLAAAELSSVFRTKDGAVAAVTSSLRMEEDAWRHGYAARVKEDAKRLSAEGRETDADVLLRTATRKTEEKLGLVILVDQLEQIWSKEELRASSAAFLEVLDALARIPGVLVLCTLRSDFFQDALRCRNAWPDVFRESSDAFFTISAPTTDELHEMIVAPARLAGLDFEISESEGSLAMRLLEEARESPDGLPLLEFCLGELYSATRRVPGLTTITHRTFSELGDSGGLPGLIGVKAEEVFSRLSEDSKGSFDRVFFGLINPPSKDRPATRRRATFSSSDSGANGLIGAFATARLFTLDRDLNDLPTAQISHEALIRSWPRLAAHWIPQFEDILRKRERAYAAFQRWQSVEMDDSLLLPSGPALSEGTELIRQRGLLEEPLAAYIEKSILHAEQIKRDAERKREDAQEQRLQLVRRSAILLSILLLAALVAAAVAARSSKRARTEQAKSELLNAENEFQLACADFRNGDRESSMRRLAKATRSNPSNVGARFLASHLLFHSPFAFKRELNVGAPIHAVAFSRDETAIAAACDDGNVLVLESKAGAQIASLKHQSVVWDVSFHPSRDLVVTACANGDVTVWDFRRGASIKAFAADFASQTHNSRSAGPNVPSAESARFSPDGRTLAWARDGRIYMAADWENHQSQGRIVWLRDEMQVHSVDWSPDGKLLGFSTSAGDAWVYSLQTTQSTRLVGEEKETAYQEKDRSRAVAFGADGSFFCARDRGDVRGWPTEDLSIRLTNERSGAGEWRTSGYTTDSPRVMNHPQAVHGIASFSRGRQLITGSLAGFADIWNLVTNTKVAQLKHGSPVWSVAASKSLLATAGEDGKIRLWHNDGEHPGLIGKSVQSDMWELDVSRTNRLMTDFGGGERYEISTFREIDRIFADRKMDWVIIAARDVEVPKSDRRNLDDRDINSTAGDLGLVRKWKKVDLTVKKSLSEAPSSAWPQTSRNLRIGFASRNGGDTPRFLPKWTFSLHNIEGKQFANIRFPAWTAICEHPVSGEPWFTLADGGICRLDPKSGQSERFDLGMAMNRLSWTPDGRVAVLSSEKGTVLVFDLASKKVVRRFNAPQKNILIRDADSPSQRAIGFSETRPIVECAIDSSGQLIFLRDDSGEINVVDGRSENFGMPLFSFPSGQYGGVILTKSGPAGLEIRAGSVAWEWPFEWNASESADVATVLEWLGGEKASAAPALRENSRVRDLLRWRIGDAWNREYSPGAAQRWDHFVSSLGLDAVSYSLPHPAIRGPHAFEPTLANSASDPWLIAGFLGKTVGKFDLDSPNPILGKEQVRMHKQEFWEYCSSELAELSVLAAHHFRERQPSAPRSSHVHGASDTFLPLAVWSRAAVCQLVALGPEKAMPLLEEARRTEPNAPVVVLSHALALAMTGDVERSRAALDSVAWKNTESPVVGTLAGLVHLWTKDYRSASDVFRAVCWLVEKDNTSGECSQELAALALVSSWLDGEKEFAKVVVKSRFVDPSGRDLTLPSSAYWQWRESLSPEFFRISPPECASALDEARRESYSLDANLAVLSAGFDAACAQKPQRDEIEIAWLRSELVKHRWTTEFSGLSGREFEGKSRIEAIINVFTKFDAIGDLETNLWRQSGLTTADIPKREYSPESELLLLGTDKPKDTPEQESKRVIREAVEKAKFDKDEETRSEREAIELRREAAIGLAEIRITRKSIENAKDILTLLNAAVELCGITDHELSELDTLLIRKAWLLDKVGRPSDALGALNRLPRLKYLAPGRVVARFRWACASSSPEIKEWAGDYLKSVITSSKSDTSPLDPFVIGELLFPEADMLDVLSGAVADGGLHSVVAFLEGMLRCVLEEGDYQKPYTARSDPLQVTAYAAWSLHQWGDTAKAKAWLARVIQIVPSHAQARGIRGHIALAEGRYAEAWEEYRIATLNKFPEGDRFSLYGGLALAAKLAEKRLENPIGKLLEETYYARETDQRRVFRAGGSKWPSDLTPVFETMLAEELVKFAGELTYGGKPNEREKIYSALDDAETFKSAPVGKIANLRGWLLLSDLRFDEAVGQFVKSKADTTAKTEIEPNELKWRLTHSRTGEALARWMIGERDVPLELWREVRLSSPRIGDPFDAPIKLGNLQTQFAAAWGTLEAAGLEKWSELKTPKKENPKPTPKDLGPSHVPLPPARGLPD